MQHFLNQIIHDDCLNILKQLPDKCIDLTLTDPPYGIGNKFTSEFGLQVKKSKRGSFDWNNKIPSEEIFREMFRVSKNLIIFGGNYCTQYLAPTNAWIVWDKIGELNLKNPFSDCELAWTSFNFPMKKYTVINMGFISQKQEKAQRIHPTQKPLKLFEMIINDHSKAGDVIFDGFSGSATTAVAAYNLSRQFICVEIDKDYHQASLERFNNHTKQLILGVNQ